MVIFKNYQLWLIVFSAMILGVGSFSRVWASPSSSHWHGDWFPNIVLKNQDGKKLHFYDDLIKGKVVAINFIFTSCTASCPLETAKLKQVQDLIGEKMGREIHFISISIDPDEDSVEVLKAYADKFKVGPGWDFLTGNKKEIDGLRKKLGLLGVSESEQERANHSLSFIVGNEATGQWMKRSPMDNPKLLAGLLRDDLRNFKEERKGAGTYANLPKVAGVSNGETLFRTRCLACHTLGGGNSLGPDLTGVVKRRKISWLTRWIKEPDVMIAEKDPIATKLYLQYNRIAMPNLKLSEHDISNVLEYIKNK